MFLRSGIVSRMKWWWMKRWMNKDTDTEKFCFVFAFWMEIRDLSIAGTSEHCNIYREEFCFRSLPTVVGRGIMIPWQRNDIHSSNGVSFEGF